MDQHEKINRVNQSDLAQWDLARSDLALAAPIDAGSGNA
jgi:hypothetical protein